MLLDDAEGAIGIIGFDDPIASKNEDVGRVPSQQGVIVDYEHNGGIFWICHGIRNTELARRLRYLTTKRPQS